MPTGKPRFTVIVDEELLKEIDDFRFENRYPSRSAATIDLIRRGIEQLQKGPGEGSFQLRSFPVPLTADPLYFHTWVERCRKLYEQKNPPETISSNRFRGFFSY